MKEEKTAEQGKESRADQLEEGGRERRSRRSRKPRPGPGEGRYQRASIPHDSLGAEALKLRFVKALVGRAAVQQFRVGPNGLDAPVGQDDNAVGDLQRVEAVGDHYGRAVADEVAQGPMDQRLALGIGLAGTLVEDEDARIAQDGPRQGNPLLLPAGELAASLADPGVVA